MKPESDKPMSPAEMLNFIRSQEAPDLSVKRILEGFIRQMGGVDEFCKQLALDYRKAKPGSPTRQRIGQLVANLAIAYARVADEEAKAKRDLSQVTDEELEAALRSLLAPVVRVDGQAPQGG